MPLRPIIGLAGIAAEEPERRRNIMRWVTRFAAACFAAIIVVLGLFWVFGGFDSLGLDTSGIIALSLGILFTTALGVGLMAAIFYSEHQE
jgi:hypothetical protein